MYAVESKSINSTGGCIDRHVLRCRHRTRRTSTIYMFSLTTQRISTLTHRLTPSHSRLLFFGNDPIRLQNEVDTFLQSGERQIIRRCYAVYTIYPFRGRSEIRLALDLKRVHPNIPCDSTHNLKLGFGFVAVSGLPEGQPSYVCSTSGHFPETLKRVSGISHLGRGYSCPQNVYRSVYVPVVV